MKILPLALFVATLTLPVAAPASDLGDVVVAHWSCEPMTRPSQREVAAWFGVANFDQAYELRMRTHLVLQRACKQGARRVELVLQRAGDGTLALVARR